MRQQGHSSASSTTTVHSGGGSGAGAGDGDTDTVSNGDDGVRHPLWTSTDELNVCQPAIEKFLALCFDRFYSFGTATDKWTMPSLSFGVCGEADIYIYRKKYGRRICLLPVEVKPFANDALANPSSDQFQAVMKQGVAYVDAVLRQSHGIINPAYGFVTDGARWVLIQRELDWENGTARTAFVQVPIHQLQTCVTCVVLRIWDTFRAWDHEDVGARSYDAYARDFREVSASQDKKERKV